MIKGRRAMAAAQYFCLPESTGFGHTDLFRALMIR
jgi:hypothetical protein